MIILETENLRATIAPKGAELQSLVNKQTGIEHMWSGDAKYWGKYSPVLFPIVGGLKNNTYYFEDKTYTLPRHGFAREKIFKAEKINETEAMFTLRHSEETLAVYPFTFTFILRYKLNNNLLSCTYEVYNDGIANLLFSVGAHPAFAVPLTSDTDYNDYYLQFNKTETLHRWKLQEGLISASSQLVSTTNNKLLLNKELFYEDAIVLKNMQSNVITLGCSKHKHGLHFSFNDFPFFGIWAAKDAPFVCLEPWCGIADSVDHDQQLTNKEGINAVAPNTNFKRTWSVECF
jgi:galactose mutarotase-like enzyme